MRKEKEITAELLHWAQNQEDIRAMILTSSPTNPEAPTDLFSDYDVHFHHLQKILEWYIGCNHNWAVRPGKYGRHFKKYLDPETWSELKETFVGGNINENWEALFKITDLFRKIAMTVGEKLKYTYLYDLDKNVMDYLKKVKNLDKDADDLS